MGRWVQAGPPGPARRGIRLRNEAASRGKDACNGPALLADCGLQACARPSGKPSSLRVGYEVRPAPGRRPGEAIFFFFFFFFKNSCREDSIPSYLHLDARARRLYN